MGQAELQAIHDTLVDAGFRPAAPSLVEIIKCISRYRFDVKRVTLTNKCSILSQFIDGTVTISYNSNDVASTSTGSSGSGEPNIYMQCDYIFDLENISFIFVATTPSAGYIRRVYLMSIDTGAAISIYANADEMPKNTYIFDTRTTTGKYKVVINAYHGLKYPVGITLHSLTYF